MAFTSASAKLAVADNMSLTEANKGLEATLSQYEWRARSAAEATAYSMHVVDTWTAVAHNAQVSAQDLAQANERTASVARQVGVDFEFLQAAIASGVRNTGRSGAEIGNMLKSVFGSIHSDKAVKEIEALGIKMTTVADDGTVKWRKVQDVMIDLSLATKNTKKDLEGVLKAASGGKFQWAKFNSMLDYDELMRVYGVAVKSAGFTDGQIAAQMDTLSRKIEQFKAAMTGLVTESGGSFAQAMKGYLDTLTNFVNALNSVPTQVYSFAGSIAHVTIFLWLGVRAYQAFSAAVGRSTTAKALNTIAEGANTASKSLNIRATEQGIVVEAADTAATAANTAAKAANATVTTIMTGGLNLLMGALIAGAMAFDVYSMSTGGASTANEKATKSASELAATQDKLGRQENLLQSYDQRIQYIDTLVAAHGRLKDALENEQVGSKEYEKTSESLKATEKDLADVMDTTTDSIAEDTNLRMDYIEQEKTSMTNGKESIRQSINELKQKQAELTQKTFNECKARIDDINNEAISVDKAANSIVNALGQIEGAFYKYYKGKQTYYEQTSKMMKDVEENGFGDGVLGKVAQIGYMQWQTDTGNFSSEQAEYQAKEAAGNAAKIEERAKAVYESTIAGLQTSGALTAPGEGGGGTNFNTTNPGSEYDPAEKKGKKGKGSGKGREAPDWQSKLEKMQINYEVNGLFSKMKQSADDYSTSMELLNDQEKIYGSTAQSLIEKAKVQAVRMAALNKESKEAQDLADSYNSKAADMVGANQDILDSINEVTKANTEGMDLESRNAMARLQWAKIDKDTKKEILDSLKESMGEMSEGYLMMEKSISLADKAKEKANDAKKINSDVQASMYSGVFDKDKIYQRNITDINNKESIDKFGLDQRSEGYKYQTKKVEYVAELARYQQYLARRKQLQDEYNAMQQGYKDALADAQALPEGEEKIKAVKAAQEDLNNAVNDNTAGLIANKDAQGQVGVSIAESISKQKGLKDTFSDVNKQWAETTADMIVNGKSASDIMKSLWQDLAKEAIMRMFKVYTYQSQLGATAGKSKASTPVSSSGGKGKHAMGGRFSRPHTGMVAEKGTEWIIPTENNTQDSRNMVMGAASELGMLDKGGTEVEPYLKSPQVSNSITEKTSLDNSRLETLMAAQLEHNARQTEMMSAMLNSGGNSNGGSPTIVVSRMSDEDIMKAIARNPSALQGLLNSNKQSGFR
ncbi:MAG: phage tail tape measure protein [Proteocatella sp.]